MNLEGMPPDYAGKAYVKIDAMKDRHRREHDALLAIVNAANADPHPIHYNVRKAIDRGREALRGGDSE